MLAEDGGKGTPDLSVSYLGRRVDHTSWGILDADSLELLERERVGAGAGIMLQEVLVRIHGARGRMPSHQEQLHKGHSCPWVPDHLLKYVAETRRVWG